MRTIGVVTVARSDYGILLPVLRKIAAEPELRLMLFVTGMHLAPEFGNTYRLIEADGFKIAAKVEMLLASDTPEGVAKSVGLGIIGFGQAYSQLRPDLLLVLGDRFETLAAVTAAMPFNIPIGHIHGGESTEGLIDEPIRHSITKMSHLHFVSTETYRQRVVQLGETPEHVILSGAPSLDNLAKMQSAPAGELENSIGMKLQPAPLLVTFHPVTLEYGDTAEHIAALLKALDTAGMPVLFTFPNADTSGRIIIDGIKGYIASHSNAKAVVNLGTAQYFSIMRHAAAMVGNSSSGIIEAASFELPVVNIGSRQRGRVAGQNVIPVESNAEAILQGIRVATDDKFRQKLRGIKNPYGDGQAASRIANVLKSVKLDRALIQKRFYNLQHAS
jgi:UDP-hydrolysing UDP-N-acetyl-D-glucosamine 2-epimerase